MQMTKWPWRTTLFFTKYYKQRKILKYKLCRVVDPSKKVPDLNREGQDLLLEVVDLKRKVSDLRSCGIRPNLTRSYVPSPRLRVSLTPSAWQWRRASSACATMTSSIKPEVHNASLCGNSRTEPRPQVTYTKDLMKIWRVFPRTQYNTIRGEVIILLLQLCKKIHGTEYNIIRTRLDYNTT